MDAAVVEVQATEVPWVAVEAVCGAYGVRFATAKNQICAGTFPVPTYKVGKTLVIDKAVHKEFFMKHREAGLRVINTTKS